MTWALLRTAESLDSSIAQTQFSSSWYAFSARCILTIDKHTHTYMCDFNGKFYLSCK